MDDRGALPKLRKEAPDTEVVCFSGEDDAVAYAFTRDYVMPSTDAGNYEPGQGHPQAAASFPLFFRVLVREKRQMSWPEAVRRATLLPAETMGLSARAACARAWDADLVAFDPRTIDSRADFAGIGVPTPRPSGSTASWIGGRQAVDGTKILNDRLGKILKRSP